MIDILAVCGPTAVGKTSITLDLCRKLNGEIISCDSMQIYRGMDIGSAKPNNEELNRIPHHLIDILDPKDDFSAAEFSRLARYAISDINKRGKLPVLSGGTGLYMDSVIYEMDFAAEPPEHSNRDKYYKIAETKGPDALYEILREKDPNSAKRIHPNNIKRVVRALEAAEEGSPIGDFSVKPKRRPEYNAIIIGLKRNREELYDRINSRVDFMMENGLLDEVKKLVNMGLNDKMISMKGIGYKELISYLNENSSLNDAINDIKTNSRHYAKRQMTWLRKYGDEIKWFDISKIGSEEKTIKEINDWLAERL